MHVKRTIPYHNSIYNRLPEDEHSGSKYVEDVKIENSNINLENVHFAGLYCVITLQYCVITLQYCIITLQYCIITLQYCIITL